MTDPFPFGDHFTYDHESQEHISFPLGGLGAGCLGLSGRGRLIDWEIFNRPNKGSTHGYTHFLIRAERDGKVIDARVLNGPLEKNRSGDINQPNYQTFGFGAKREYLSGLPNFSACTFRGFYPLAELDFEEDAFPGAVSLQALSPFLPGDVRSSGLPVAMFEIEIENTTDGPLTYALLGTLAGHPEAKPSARIRDHGDGAATLSFDPGAAADPKAMGTGAVALTFLDGEISGQHYWYRGHWFDALQKYWNDVTTPGPLRDRTYEGDRVAGKGGSANDRDHGSLAARVTLAPGERRKLRAAINWRFPNFRKYWSSKIRTTPEATDTENHWRMQHADWWPDIDAAVDETRERWQDLWHGTRRFAETLRVTTLPDPVLDAVSANLSTLKSPTVALFEGEMFYGFEGCHAVEGCCEGSCTHVWNYQQALPFLFPTLAQSLVATDFRYNQDPETGGMSFRTPAPFGSKRNLDRAAADGHFGTVVRAWREVKATGDDTWLRTHWDDVKAAIAFAWHPGNYDKWDVDKTGVLWGRQHHTLDMELFGPNSWLTSYYLAALKAGAEMAEHLGDSEAATDYRAMFEAGKGWSDEHLFNGRYYFQKLDLTDLDLLRDYEDAHHPVLTEYENGVTGSAPEVVTADSIYWNEEAQEMKYQIGDGMVIDQVTGCWLAAVAGLGEIFDPAQVRTSLCATFEESFSEDLRSVANPCRVFALDGEGGTVICSWPEGTHQPDIPLPYAQETQGGYEYAFGGALLSVSDVGKGARVFAAIRGRYRGWNRNPWNEIECGSNYARAMASYAAIPLLQGFTYDMRHGHIGVDPKIAKGGHYRSLWAVAGAWGKVVHTGETFRLEVLGGEIRLQRLDLLGITSKTEVRFNGTAVAASRQSGITFDRLELKSGDHLAIGGLTQSLDNLPDVDAIADTLVQPTQRFGHTQVASSCC